MWNGCMDTMMGGINLDFKHKTGDLKHILPFPFQSLMGNMVCPKTVRWELQEEWSGYIIIELQC